jgi:hypothetical protein
MKGSICCIAGNPLLAQFINSGTRFRNDAEPA